MKKSQFIKAALLSIVMLVTANVFTQNAYFGVNAGYGLGLSTGTMGDLYNFTADDNGVNFEQVYLSLGKGLNAGGTFGFMFNRNVGAELSVNYLLGAKTEATYTQTYSSKNYETGNNVNADEDIDTYRLYSKMIRVTPAIVFAAGTDVVNPYAKIGAVLGSGSIFFEMEYEDNFDGEKTEYFTKMKLNGGLAAGVTASLGAFFELSDNFSFFAEINTVNMSYAPTKGEVIEATVDGEDVLSDYDVYEKEVNYVDDYTFDPDASADEPDTELRQKFPFGSIGINAGLIITL